VIAPGRSVEPSVRPAIQWTTYVCQVSRAGTGNAMLCASACGSTLTVGDACLGNQESDSTDAGAKSPAHAGVAVLDADVAGKVERAGRDEERRVADAVVRGA
jgi:hypothetical protein